MYAPYYMMGPFWANNARVYYKPHSLASCGVGTVRNASSRARRI